MDLIMKLLICFIYLIGIVRSNPIENSGTKEAISNLLPKFILHRNSTGQQSEDHVLVEKWQDFVLANAILANYLNILVIHGSKPDFSLLKQSNQCLTYIKTPASFRQTVVQLNGNIRLNLVHVHTDLNSVPIVLEKIPMHLKTILLLIKKGTDNATNTHLPNLLEKGEALNNASFAILKNLETRIQHIDDLLAELNTSIFQVTSDVAITSQVEDVSIKWTQFRSLFSHLAIQAENSINDFLLQFNWMLEQFIPLNISRHRDLIVDLLQPKLLEIERTVDFLTIISETYVDISNEYSTEILAHNGNLILTANEPDRKKLIKQYRYELQPIVVKFARLALKRHDEFLERNEMRQQELDSFLNDMTQSDLDLLLSMD